MSQTGTTIGFGIGIGFSATSGGGPTPIAEILELDPPESSFEEVKTYRSDNPAGAVVEKTPGWREDSNAKYRITYKPTQRAALEAINGQPQYWTITYPKCPGQTVVGDSEKFYGFISKLGKQTPLKEAMTCSIEISISGASVATQGS